MIDFFQVAASNARREFPVRVDLTEEQRAQEQRARNEEVYLAYIRRWFAQTDGDRVSTALVTKA